MLIIASIAPVSAWEDPKLRPYVPSMYAVCGWWREDAPERALGSGWLDPSCDLGRLPARAQDLLRGTERDVPLGGEWAKTPYA